MAGRVAHIEDVIKPEGLARNLSALYNKWWLQRQAKESEWRELRNYLFATDTRKTSNSQLPWKNSTTLPKLTQIRDNLHANYMDALFPNDDWLRWEGYSQQDVVKSKRRAIESYMKTKCRDSGFRETIAQCLYDYIDTGNPFAEAIWVHEKHIDPSTGEEVTTYIGPKALRISPYDHVFNPTAASYKDSPKFTRYVKTLGELKKEMKQRPDLMFDDTAFLKAIDARKTMSGFKVEDFNKAEGYTIDGFGSLQEYYQSDLIELLEFEGDFYDNHTDTLYENRIITIIDRAYIIRNVPNPSWFGTDNKVHCGWRERPDNLYAMGPLDNLVGLQYRVDHMENLKADALDQTILPPKAIIGDVEPFEWGPDAEIHLPEDGDIKILAPNPAAFQVNNEIAVLLQLMEEMAGAPKEAMGIRTPGEKTAFEVQQLQNAAGRLFQHKVNKFEIEFLEPLLNKMLELSKRNLSAVDIARTLDDDLGAMEFINITKEDLTASGKLRPIGSRHYAARAQLVQNLAALFNSPVAAKIDPHVSAKQLALLVEDYMGFDRYGFIKENIAVFEQAETAKLANQVSQQAEIEQATPVEEALL